MIYCSILYCTGVKVEQYWTNIRLYYYSCQISRIRLFSRRIWDTVFTVFTLICSYTTEPVGSSAPFIRSSPEWRRDSWRRSQDFTCSVRELHKCFTAPTLRCTNASLHQHCAAQKLYYTNTPLQQHFHSTKTSTVQTFPPYHHFTAPKIHCTNTSLHQHITTATHHCTNTSLDLHFTMLHYYSRCKL